MTMEMMTVTGSVAKSSPMNERVGQVELLTAL